MTIQPQDKYMLRFPDGMRDRIKAVAEANNRSMNAEIISALEMYLPPPPHHEEVLGNLIRAAIKNTDKKKREILLSRAEEYAIENNIDIAIAIKDDEISLKWNAKESD